MQIGSKQADETEKFERYVELTINKLTTITRTAEMSC